MSHIPEGQVNNTPPRRLYIHRCITKGMTERKMVVPKSRELFEAEYLILTIFFRVLNFANIQQPDFASTNFRDFVFVFKLS